VLVLQITKGIEMTPSEIERGLLFNSLANMGQYIKLKMNVDPMQ
jgi:hypothetical protein